MTIAKAVLAADRPGCFVFFRHTFMQIYTHIFTHSPAYSFIHAAEYCAAEIEAFAECAELDDWSSAKDSAHPDDKTVLCESVRRLSTSCVSDVSFYFYPDKHT